MKKMKLKQLIFIILIISSCNQKSSEGEDFIIPNNFIGEALIAFEQEDGKEIKYKDGRRIYEINNEGILKTKFEVNPYGIVYDRNFYYQNGGKYRKLKYIDGHSLLHRYYDTTQTNSENKTLIDPDSIVVLTSIGNFERDSFAINRSELVFGKEFKGKIKTLKIDTFKNLLKYQRLPDSIYYKYDNI